MTRPRRTLALLVAGAAVLATAAPAAIAAPARAATTSAAADDCPADHVCVFPIWGMAVLVPEGGYRTFPDGTRATVVNRTRVQYCVAGDPNVGLPPGGAVTEIRPVTAVGPMPPGGACLH